MNGMVNPNMMNPGMRGMMSMNNGMQVKSLLCPSKHIWGDYFEVTCMQTKWILSQFLREDNNVLETYIIINTGI